MALNETIAQLYAELGRARAGQFASLGQMGAQIAQSFSPERQAERDLLSARAGLAKAELQSTQDTQRANQVLDQALQPVQPQGPQEPGAAPMTPSHPYLDDNGLIDPTKVTGLLAANGLAHAAPDILKGIDAQNEAITKHQQTMQSIAKQNAITLGTVANTTLKLMDAGLPFDQAATHAGASLVATGVLKPEQLQAQIQQLGQLSPDQQRAALMQAKAQAAQLAPTKTIGEGGREVDIFGETVAANPKVVAPTRASLATAAAAGDKGAQHALDLMTAPKTEELRPEQRLVNGKPTDVIFHATGDLAGNYTLPGSRDVVKTEPIKAPPSETTKPKSQDELEQEYRGLIQREFSSRSGGMGLEDGKVNQARHLLALMDQYEGKNMPAQISAELALGLARLTSPNGQVGIELEKEFKQRTAQEGVAKAVAWLTGDPQLVNATPDALREMYRDSITRQGQVAQGNREAYFEGIKAAAPTQLDPKRKTALEGALKLNRMPAPKGSPPEGTQRNGATWEDGPQGWGWYK